MCGKTAAQMGRQHQEGLLIATEYERMEETSKGQGYLEANFSRGQGPMRTVAPLKKKKKKKKKNWCAGGGGCSLVTVKINYS
jgi:hypothetical protein